MRSLILPDVGITYLMVLAFAMVARRLRGARRIHRPDDRANPAPTSSDVAWNARRRNTRAWVAVVCAGSLIASAPQPIIKILGAIIGTAGAIGGMWCLASLPSSRRTP